MITKAIASVMLVVYLVLFASWCDKTVNFAKHVLAALDNYPALIASLNLPISNELTTDFKGLTAAAVQLSDDFKAIPANDPQSRQKHLAAINTFGDKADAIFALGHFENHTKLKAVKFAVKGVVVAAKVYYSAFGASPETNKKNEENLKLKINELKMAMRP